MGNLLYKELKLSINKFFYILPFIIACLMFIPQWIYTFVFMYFFWITISQICAGYIAKEDNSFISMLPVSKKDIVKSKIFAILIIQLIHLLSGVLFGMLHNNIYGTYNFFLEVNTAFFGAMIVMYAVFNLTFFPVYFKTAYFFGKAVIYGVAITLVYAFVLEYGSLRIALLQDIFKGGTKIQLIVLAVSVILSVVMTYITIKLSVRNFERNS